MAIPAARKIQALRLHRTRHLIGRNHRTEFIITHRKPSDIFKNVEPRISMAIPAAK